MPNYKFKIMERNISKTTNKIGFAIFILIGAILILFTFKTPPHYDIFRDSNTGQYGIEEKQ